MEIQFEFQWNTNWNFNEIVRFPRRNWRRWGGAELAGFSLGRVDPATLQATKIACAHPPSLSFSGRVCNFRRTGIIVRGYVWGTFGSPDVSIRPSQTHKQRLFTKRYWIIHKENIHKKQNNATARNKTLLVGCNKLYQCYLIFGWGCVEGGLTTTCQVDALMKMTTMMVM